MNTISSRINTRSLIYTLLSYSMFYGLFRALPDSLTQALKANGIKAKIELLQRMPRGSVCAEVGVWRGDFSRLILRTVKPAKLHLIDAWQYQPEVITWEGNDKMSQAKLDGIYEDVRKVFQREIDESTVGLHRGYSHEIAEQFSEGYFDWVYIDADHRYSAVKRDLSVYYEKVKVGGFIAGDDYGDETEIRRDVKRAVDEFVQSFDVEWVWSKYTQFILRKTGP